MGGQGGYDPRYEVFGKDHKKNQGGGRFGGVRVGGVRVDVNEEVFVKIPKKNKKLGGSGLGGQGGCERRIEVSKTNGGVVRGGSG